MNDRFIENIVKKCESGVHKFSEWRYMDSVSDERCCIYCGEKEIRTIYDDEIQDDEEEVECDQCEGYGEIFNPLDLLEPHKECDHCFGTGDKQD